ncbi:hypothetical protein BSIN_2543 [Burkholderia singularis]|uniref:Uncharacterized protein n=1 Tax=Burkholderia singularis TaxID=1503053 RepID=A0A238H324_9BURK|nr:hypothetical protein BSIN_2543 [Burkholderia singularis]
MNPAGRAARLAAGCRRPSLPRPGAGRFARRGRLPSAACARAARPRTATPAAQRASDPLTA